MFYTTQGKTELTPATMDKMVQFCVDHLSMESDVYECVDVIFKKLDVCGHFDFDEGEDVWVEVNSDLKGEELVRTVFHEMVHVAQFLSGRYVPGEGSEGGRWFGVEHKGNYWDLPWEKEAYDLENEMWEIWNDKG